VRTPDLAVIGREVGRRIGAALRRAATRAAVGAAACALFAASAPRSASAAEALTMDRAVAVAFQRNRDVIAARLEIQVAEVDRIAAGLYWNPQFSYTFGNIVLGKGNPQGDQNLNPGPFSQPIQSIGISEVIDVWAKRSARIKMADLGVELRRLRVEDAMREIALAVRAAFTDLVREQEEHELSVTMKSRYDETVRISRARVKGGEISEFEGQKIELEGMKYQNALIDADLELDLARQHLAAIMGLPSIAELGGNATAAPVPRTPFNVEPLIANALEHRPDLRAARRGHAFADALLSSAKREAYPDISVGATYTHSEFTASGDNANALALGVSLPLPLFDRNQANVARARLEERRVTNDEKRLELVVRYDVLEAVRNFDRSRALLDVYEGGGLLSRAENALRVAESSYKAGAVSLLELLEAQRTFIETRAQYLRVQDDHRKAMSDVAHAVGREP